MAAKPAGALGAQPGVVPQGSGAPAQPNNEYRATLRNLVHLGGTITYTTNTITLDTPTTLKITQALLLLGPPQV
jgi:hypothetical protein